MQSKYSLQTDPTAPLTEADMKTFLSDVLRWPIEGTHGLWSQLALATAKDSMAAIGTIESAINQRAYDKRHRRLSSVARLVGTLCAVALIADMTVAWQSTAPLLTSPLEFALLGILATSLLTLAIIKFNRPSSHAERLSIRPQCNEVYAALNNKNDAGYLSFIKNLFNFKETVSSEAIRSFVRHGTLGGDEPVQHAGALKLGQFRLGVGQDRPIALKEAAYTLSVKVDHDGQVVIVTHFPSITFVEGPPNHNIVTIGPTDETLTFTSTAEALSTVTTSNPADLPHTVADPQLTSSDTVQTASEMASQTSGSELTTIKPIATHSATTARQHVPAR